MPAMRTMLGISAAPPAAPDPRPRKWHRKVGEVANSQAHVTGLLAGFSVTVIAIIAGLQTDKPTLAESEFYRNVVVLFVAALLSLIGASVIYSLVGLRREEKGYLLYSLATAQYYLGVVLIFCGLHTLISEVLGVKLGYGLPVMIWGTAISGYFIATIPLGDLFRIDLRILFLFLLLAGLLALVLSVAQISLRLLLFSLVIAVDFGSCLFCFYFDKYLSSPLVVRLVALVVYLAVSALALSAAASFGI